MNTPSAWKYINKGLLAILAVFVLATITSIVFLSYNLLKLDSVISKSGQNIGTAFVLQNLFINLDDAETNSQAYVITGDARYLKPYSEATRDVSKNLTSLASNQHTNLSTAQKQKVKTLAQDTMTALKQAVDTRTSGDEDAAKILMTDGRIGGLTDQIRSTVRSISAISLNEIEPRQRQSHNNLRRALAVAGALSVFVLGICAMLVWYFQYTIRRERILEGTKSEFLSLASHQLRTPATNVKQYVGLLLDGYLGDMTEKQRDALRVAYKNNELEIRIMNDLLDVAKLDLQRIQIHKRRVNVVSMVKQVVNDNNQYTDTHGQTVILKAPPEMMVMVDRIYFRGVIEKLIDNAVKYSHDKTRITVRVRANEENNTFEVIVRDHGLGIHKREVSKLFMKFSRLTNELSANTEGSGLGLYWVKQIMVLHGGSVNVVSKEGRGSKFTVRAPIS